MSAVGDQQPVEALSSDGTDESLGDRVCLRGADRCADPRLTVGRPRRRPGYVQWRDASRRCQASNVSGVTKNERHRVLGSRRLAAAKKARSAGRNAGRDTCRRSIASSWRSTTISSSLKSDERKRSNTSAITRAHTSDATSSRSPKKAATNARLSFGTPQGQPAVTTGQ